jgi:hypothetical protein
LYFAMVHSHIVYCLCCAHGTFRCFDFAQFA